MKDLKALSCIASFPGRMGGEKAATACACVSIPRKTWEFMFVCKINGR